MTTTTTITPNHAAWCREIARFTATVGTEPTARQFSAWVGCAELAGDKRIVTLVEGGLAQRTRERLPRLVLTERGCELAASSDGVEGAPRAVYKHVVQRIGHELTGDAPGRTERLAIVRAVVEEMGTSRDEDRTMDTCPVIVEVLRRYRERDLGEAPFSLEECGVVLGLSKERIRQIEMQALAHARARLGRRAHALREELAELDGMRGGLFACEDAA